jgi:hypothetical protein
MREAARKSQRAFDETRTRAWKSFERILQGLFNHCDVPLDAITLLKWNGRTDDGREYRPADSGKYTLMGATVFDESDQYWHLGVHIDLSQIHFVFFTLCYSERDGIAKIKLGTNGKPEALNIESEENLGAFCESICDAIVRAYGEPKSSGGQIVGFGANPG